MALPPPVARAAGGAGDAALAGLLWAIRDTCTPAEMVARAVACGQRCTQKAPASATVGWSDVAAADHGYAAVTRWRNATIRITKDTRNTKKYFVCLRVPSWTPSDDLQCVRFGTAEGAAAGFVQ